MNFEEEIKKILKKELGQEVKLEIPSNQEFGDYAYPCFDLAGKLKKNPSEIARDLASRIKSELFTVHAAGPYVNFKIDKKKITKTVIDEIIKKKDDYGRQNIGKGKKILIEHTSINPNASPHVGRAINALI